MAPRTRPAQQPSVLHGPLQNLEKALANQARIGESYCRGALPVAPTHIVCGPISVLISSSPSNDTLDLYANILRSHRVTHVVRVCESSSYDENRLRAMGFLVKDLPFPDGEPPPATVIAAWLALLDENFQLVHAPVQSAPPSPSLSLHTDEQSPRETVAIHCAAGVGRAPVLVALALIELGLEPFDAVAFIRTRRRGAINGPQTAFLQTYVPRRAQPSPKHKRSRSTGLSSFFAKGIKATGARRSSSRPGTPPAEKDIHHVLSPASVVDISG